MNMGDSIELKNIDGLVLRKFRRLRNRYKAAYLQWRDNRWRNIESIQPIIQELEETRNNCNIASLTGGCAGLAGGLLTGAGLIAIPFTVGASAPLIIAGASLAVSGGATGFGAGVVDIKISNNKCKAAQMLIDRDVQLTMDLLLAEKEYVQCLSLVESCLLDLQSKQPEHFNQLSHYLTSSMSALGGVSRFGANLALVALVARSIYLARVGSLSLTTARVVNHVNPLSLLGAARVADSVDDVLEAGGQVGVAAARGARAGVCAAAILCVVGLALDITSIIYTSRQIHVYRKQKQVLSSDCSTTKKENDSNQNSDSVNEFSSQQFSNNNNKIKLKSVNKELDSDYDLCSWLKYPSNGNSWNDHKCITGDELRKNKPFNELWSDFTPPRDDLWTSDECCKSMEVSDESSLSRSLSGSWEQIDVTPDMLIEVEEECPFKDKTLSLAFEQDLIDSGFDDDKQNLISSQNDKNIGPTSLRGKVFRKVKHSFTKDYISERAQRLKKYIDRLYKEAVLMEKNPTMTDLLNECTCQQCFPVGYGSTVYCCHKKRLYWNCVYRCDKDIQAPTHHTPSRCVTQHPLFQQLYLDENNLQAIMAEEENTRNLPRHRWLRYCAYRLIIRNCWGNNDITIKLPDCIRRTVVETFKAEVEDYWSSKDGFGLSQLWLAKDSITCSIM